MKRFESGYGMKIIMKPDASDKQLQIARKMYPKALVVRGLKPSNIDLKTYEEVSKILLKTNTLVKEGSGKTVNIESKTDEMYLKDIYRNPMGQNIVPNSILAFAA